MRRVVVPQEGGIKDLTALALMQSLGWDRQKLIRMPSGDAAILSFVGNGADAASMVEPYATMLEVLQLGRVVRRTGDVWPGASPAQPGDIARPLGRCTGASSEDVAAYVKGANFVHSFPAK